MGQEVMRWGDDAMYTAQPMLKEDARVTPRVFLLSATGDPLGTLAAGMRMYRGDPPYDLAEVTDDERRWAWEESIKGHLKAPWEFIDFVFMIEGVTRAFTHQMVRQRTAVYAQESLRFAVKEGFASEVAVPPSLVGGDENLQTLWSQCVKNIERTYHSLVNAGVPAEDARSLLPHCVTTRLIYKTTFRGLVEHAGNRLCTQAQFEWRAVFLGIMKAIRGHGTSLPELGSGFDSRWQFELIAQPRPETFAPVCYHVGHCTFKSELDRGCKIRERVDTFAEHGVPPTEWGAAIDPAEWMADSTAGVTSESNERPT